MSRVKGRKKREETENLFEGAKKVDTYSKGRFPLWGTLHPAHDVSTKGEGARTSRDHGA